MDIYVQSCGEPQELGYCWLRQIPELLSSTKIMDLIEQNAYSIVLARHADQLCLLVAGLKSQRKDFRGRVIRNSVFWISSGRREDEQLRAIAISALHDELTEPVDKLIWFDANKGFDFDQDGLAQLNTGIQPANQEPEPKCKIAKLSDELREDLALELERYSLPAGNGPLVVVTGNRSEDVLKEARIWRGLSKLVKSDEWQEILDPETGQPVFFMIAIALVLLVAIVLLVIVLFPRQPQPEPLEVPESSQMDIQKNSLTMLQESSNLSPQE